MISHPLTIVPDSAAAFAALPTHHQHALLAGDPRTAFRCVDMMAQAGVIEAELRLGRMLLAGTGCAADAPRALAWFCTAARDGDADAMNMVGRCHENGWGTKPDMAEAAAWYRRAALRGDAWAQYNLGHALLDGNGVAKDQAEAFAWYLRAAMQGHARAMNLVARCLDHGWGIARNRLAAIDWYRKSAEGGYFRGQFNYATLLLMFGRQAEARLWLRRARETATDAVVKKIDVLLNEPFVKRPLTGMDDAAPGSARAPPVAA